VTGFAGSEAIRWATAAVLLLPASAVLGVVYPVSFRLSVFPTKGRAALAARMAAWNSVGCVLGALGCGFVLIPTAGSETTLRGLIASLAVVGAGLGLRWAVGRERQALAASAVVLMALALALPKWNRLDLTSGGHVYFDTGFVTRDSTLEFFHEDTLGGITTVVRNAGRDGSVIRTLLTNGKFQANDAAEARVQIGLAVVPMTHLRHFDEALVVGLGSGHTAAVVAQAGFSRVEVAEISPGIIEAARQCFSHLNGRALDDARVSVVLEDGRNHLALSKRRYDLITLQLTSLWFAGASNLYSTEFYALARARMKPGGVLQQWIQVHHVTVEEITSAMRALREVFPVVSFWVVENQGLLLATDGAQHPTPEALVRLTSRIDWRPSAATPDQALARVLSSRLLAPGDVDAWLASHPGVANTDSNRFLEYSAPKYNLDPRPLGALNLRALAASATWPSWDTEGWPEPLGALVRAETGASRRSRLAP
jgi:spermidine synthase